MKNSEKLAAKLLKQNHKDALEMERLEIMYSFERKSYSEGFVSIAGIDEAGRGPLAGPVVAAAVILPKDLFITGVNDSKKISAKNRDLLFDEIREKAISFSVGIVDEKIIDQINILNATKKAMKIALAGLNPSPDIVLIDAVRLDDISLTQIPIIKGDEKSISIAAASIIAKVTRDRIMDEFSIKFPKYNFSKNKGYGTKEHIEALKEIGFCPIHRMSFIKNFISK